MSEQTAIRISKGVPMPFVKPRGRNGTKPAKYPWREMKVGDSFLFPVCVGRAGHTAALQASVDGRKFKVCKMDDGYRCWRVQ